MRADPLERVALKVLDGRELRGARLDAALADLRKELGGKERYPDFVHRLQSEQARVFGARYAGEVGALAPHAARITDKMPHNFERLGLIALLLPKARVIHCRRDPRDTCVSCYMQHFQDRHAYNRDLRALGLYYRQYERLMAHWRAVLPHPPLEVQLELCGALAKMAAGAFPGARVSGAEGGARVEVKATYLEGLLRHALSLGKDCKVVAPESAVAEYRKIAQRIAEAHGEPRA